MAEYIERDETCENCVHYGVCYHIEHYGRDIETDEPCKHFKSDDVVEVVHGEWVVNEQKDSAECSVCKREALADPNGIGIDFVFQELTDYCPNCGAKMDAERKCEDG